MRRGRFIEPDIFCPDDELAAFRHGVPRVDAEIQNHLLDLARVGFDPPDFRIGMRLQIEPLADDAAQKFFHLDDERVEVDHLRLENLFPAEGEQLACEGGGLFAGFANEIGVLFHQRIGLRARRDQFRVADDRG